MPPRILKAIFFSVDDVQHQALVSSSEIVSPDPVIWRGGDPSTVYSDTPAEGTMLNITGIQDWEDEDGICNTLLSLKGQQADVLFSPRIAGDAYFTVRAVLKAPSIGGKINSFNEFTLALQCVSDVELADRPLPVITTTAFGDLSNGDVFTPLQLAATGAQPLVWAVTTGTLPAGITLSESGLVSGTPSATGAYSVTISATNSLGTDTQVYTGTVAS